MQLCPHCGRDNADSDTYCYACGHILPAAVAESGGVTEKLSAEVYEALEPRRRWGTAYFDQTARLRLKFREPDKALLLEVTDEPRVIGRSHDKLDVPQPDIDLRPYKALDKGVSRNHLKIVRDQDTVAITDLGSANGTYLNGQRLIPYEARILRDGDELRLGRLVLRVAFV